MLCSEFTVFILILFPWKSKPGSLLSCPTVLYPHWCPVHVLAVTSFSFCKSVGSTSTSSGGLAGNYIPSFLKKEIGSTVQRVHVAPIPDPSPGKFYFRLLLFMNWFNKQLSNNCFVLDLVGLGSTSEGATKLPVLLELVLYRQLVDQIRCSKSAKGKLKRGVGSVGCRCILHRAAEEDLPAKEPLGKDLQEVSKKAL